jgi:hypothetical protein
MIINLPGMLLVAGNGRNSGKTTLLCTIIRHFNQHQIIGLKITRLKAGEDLFHGEHPYPPEEKFILFEETSTTSAKDTSRMLSAGAVRVFYLMCSEHDFGKAFDCFLRQIPPDSVLVCESRYLRHYVKPGVFILLKRCFTGNEASKPVTDLESFADRIIEHDGVINIVALTGQLKIENGHWHTKAPVT